MTSFEAHRADGNPSTAIREIGILTDFTCNLACDGCEIGSNLRIDDGITLHDRLRWIDLLADRCDEFGFIIKSYGIIGGEPFVNPDNLLKMAKHVRFRNPESDLMISSNGLLIARSAGVLSDLKALGAHISVTLHDDSDAILTKFTAGLYALKNSGISHSIGGLPLPGQTDLRPGTWWKIPHPLDSEGKMHPSNEDNHIRSWAACTAKFCPQLYGGAVWKCPYTAYLRQKLIKTNQLTDPEWKRYLEYEPLDLIRCSYDDFVLFFSKGPEPVCSMCPSQLKGTDRKSIVPRSKR